MGCRGVCVRNGIGIQECTGWSIGREKMRSYILGGPGG